MIESDQQSGRHVGLGAQVAAWLAMSAVLALNFALSYVPLGVMQLPVQLILAAVNLAILLWWFMRLAEDRGTRRFALPVGIGFLLLLLALTMLDVTTRFPPANPGVVQKVVEPHRPMPSRTQPLGGTEPHRLPGQ